MTYDYVTHIYYSPQTMEVDGSEAKADSKPSIAERLHDRDHESAQGPNKTSFPQSSHGQDATTRTAGGMNHSGVMSSYLSPAVLAPTGSASSPSRDSSTPTNSDKSSSGGDDNASQDKSEGSSDSSERKGAPKRKKLDRSKLRKGKWTIEEEEFTSRIIHYFSIGLVTLPEGATLRSYIAEKLNCDPMRVTKKYAGASCLGRRVFQVRDRPQPTVLELELAKAEVDMLERRFKVRVEEGRPGVPLPQPFDIALALAHQHQPQRVSPMAGGIPSWLTLNNMPSGLVAAPMEAGLGPLSLQGLQTLLRGLTPASNPVPSTTAQPMVGQPISYNAATSQQAPSHRPTASSQSLGNGGNGLQMDIALAQLLLAQAAANVLKQASPVPQQNAMHTTVNRQPTSSPQQPATTHLYSGPSIPNASAGISREQVPSPRQVPSAPVPGCTSTEPNLAVRSPKPSHNNILEELKRTYEQHLAAQSAGNGPSATNFIAHSIAAQTANAGGIPSGIQTFESHNPPSVGNGPSTAILHPNKLPLYEAPTKSLSNNQAQNSSNTSAIHGLSHSHAHSRSSNAGRAPAKPALPMSTKRSSTDSSESGIKAQKSKASIVPSQSSEDGAIMVGFLNSLRSSFENAIAQQQEARTREQQEDSEETNSSASGARHRPATVTDTSSQQQESCSSVDESDWNSEDKKTDPSSSEDSDKDDNPDGKLHNYMEAVQYSKGPPRKRHKSKKVEDPVAMSKAE